MINIAFRADASTQIGTGHVMRCLTLADALRDRGAECFFISRPHEGHLLNLIQQRGYDILQLPSKDITSRLTVESGYASWLGTDWATDAAETVSILDGRKMTWLVVDHYALDIKWETFVHSNCQRLMVIDDLANRQHKSDLLLDQNLGRSANDYRELLSENAKVLVGPHFALLRPEFLKFREYSLNRRKKPRLKNLLISMGGVDKDNITGKVLGSLKFCEIEADIQITVVMGKCAPWLDQVKQMAVEMPWITKVLSGIDNMAEFMAECDLAIGAAGSTSWERCALGVPAILFCLAENQRSVINALSACGAGIICDLNAEDQINRNFIVDPLYRARCKLKEMSKQAAAVCDADGITRVVESMVELT